MKKISVFLIILILISGTTGFAEILNVSEMTEENTIEATGEVLAEAESEEEAREIASRYGYTLKKYYPYSGIAVFEPGVSLFSVSQYSTAADDIEFYPNYCFELLDTESTYVTDPYYSGQYFHKEIGSDIARQYIMGENVTVAVLDNGVDPDHPDLTGQLSEKSYNAVTFDEGIEAAACDMELKNFGHGTHIAGIIAATYGNGVGVAGIVPDVELICVRVDYAGVDSEGNKVPMITFSAIIEGIYYAVKNGADIINISVGGDYDSYVTSANDPLHRAVKYANNNGVLVVCAAGNSKASHAAYPAAFSECVAVSALKSGYGFASTYSNYGDEIDISAPGSSIVSTYPDNTYADMTGTSMASPVVVGAAALLLSARPWLTVDELKQCLYNGALDQGDEGWDKYYGYGSVYIPGALKYAEKLYPPSLSLTKSQVYITYPPIDAVLLSAGYDSIGNLTETNAQKIKGAGSSLLNVASGLANTSDITLARAFLFESFVNLSPLCASEKSE